MMRCSLLLALLPLAACAGPAVDTAVVAPIAPPAEWRTDVGQTAALDRAWWNGFGDPQLTALVERALRNNSDILIAIARVREARAQESLARANLLPTVDASIPATRSRSVNAFGQPSHQLGSQPQIMAGWEVDLFGRLSDRAASARSGWLASEAARDATDLSVASATASGYILLRTLDARLVVARQALAARADALKLIRRRAEVGYSPRLELAQAQADYEATAQIIPPLETAIARQENALRLLTGELPGDITRGLELADLTVPPIPDGLPSQLLQRRPDVAQAEYQLAASDHDLAAARKSFLPQVRLTGAVGASISSLLDNPISIWSIGGSVLAPLFEGGRLRAGAEIAGAKRDQAAQNYRKVALGAFREVEDALAATQNSGRQVEILERQRAAAAESLRLATNRYREGYSPYFEQLDAQRGLFAVELALVQARSDALAARVQLYQAMGGGWGISSGGQ
nr:efflux transporter outer membrane subunit [uncultured Sphingomonas sp.]